MYPDSSLRTGIVRGLSLMLLAASLVSCNLANPFSSSPAPTSTRTPSSGPVTITASNVSRLVKAWSYTIGGTVQFSTAPTVADGVIYIGSVDDHTDGSETGTLYALDAVTGNERWSLAISGAISTAPTVADGVVYIDSANYYEDTSTLDALDAKTGTKLWSYSAGATRRFSTTPAIVKGMVYVASEVNKYGLLPNGMLEALDARTGTRLWIYFTGGSLEYSLIVTNTMVYVNSRKTLYAFAIPTKAPTPTATSSSSNGTTTAQHLAPSINQAPVFADIAGLHIQSTEGLQCPLSGGIGQSDDLVFTTGRLTYSKDEIQQIRNYLHEMLYGSESITTAYTITPPPTLHWVSGSAVCTLNLEISNTGNTTVQISSLGVQLASAPQPNSSQQLHTLDFCSVANRLDTSVCEGGAGGGECGAYTMNIALQAAPASSIFAATPSRGYGAGGDCPTPTLQPNDTIDIEMNLSSPGTKQGALAPYIYALVPVLTVTDANGSHTFTLSSMAGIAAFVNRQQITCYGLLHEQDTTFVPVSTFPANTPMDQPLCLA